jgi:site-specific recombinase XerD
VRNRAWIILGTRTGFRISELLSLKVGDVYQQGQIVDFITVPNDACGLTGRLGTHSMRKTFAITMYQRLNENTFKVQQALGHKWITSTQAYLPINEAEISAALLT